MTIVSFLVILHLSLFLVGFLTSLHSRDNWALIKSKIKVTLFYSLTYPTACIVAIIFSTLKGLIDGLVHCFNSISFFSDIKDVYFLGWIVSQNRYDLDKMKTELDSYYSFKEEDLDVLFNIVGRWNEATEKGEYFNLTRELNIYCKLYQVSKLMKSPPIKS